MEAFKPLASSANANSENSDRRPMAVIPIQSSKANLEPGAKTKAKQFFLVEVFLEDGLGQIHTNRSER